MARPPVLETRPLVLTAAERTSLERWARGRRVPPRLVRRARIILHAAAGESTTAIARALRTDRECVGRWRARFAAEGLAGLQHEAARPGRPPGIPDDVLHALGALLTTTIPAEGRPWSCRALARAAGVSPATIHRLCQATGLTPHWGRARRLRTPPPGFSRLTAVLGGYLTALDSAVVVGGDVVGPQRPGPPAGPRSPRRAPGVPARYAVELPPPLRVVPGSPEENRVPDWLSFLAHVAARVPRGWWVHLFADNVVTHLHPAVPAWFAQHPQVVLHLLPAGDALPRWFLPALQRWGALRSPPNPPAPLRSLRAAVTRLQPRSVRHRRPASWMASKGVVKLCCGNPRWHLPPDPWGWGPRPKTASPPRPR